MFLSEICSPLTSSFTFQFSAVRTSISRPGAMATELGAGETIKTSPEATAAMVSVDATSYVPGFLVSDGSVFDPSPDGDGTDSVGLGPCESVMGVGADGVSCVPVLSVTVFPDFSNAKS